MLSLMKPNRPKINEATMKRLTRGHKPFSSIIWQEAQNCFVQLDAAEIEFHAN
jgi:hypothetical protein